MFAKSVHDERGVINERSVVVLRGGVPPVRRAAARSDGVTFPVRLFQQRNDLSGDSPSRLASKANTVLILRLSESADLARKRMQTRRIEPIGWMLAEMGRNDLHALKPGAFSPGIVAAKAESESRNDLLAGRASPAEPYTKQRNNGQSHLKP